MDRQAINTEEDRNILTAENITVSYDGVIVLDNCSFTLEKGKFVTITGKSGAGKSTFFDCICNFIDYEGAIKRPKNIACVDQDKSVFPNMKVKKNILFGANGNKTEKQKMLSSILQQTELTGLEKRLPYQLSGGELRRVAIGQALATNAPLILLDEPFAGLDDETKKNVVDWLLGLIDGEKTFLAILHDKEDAIVLSDSIWEMSNKTLSKRIDINVPRADRKSLHDPQNSLQYLTALNKK